MLTAKEAAQITIDAHSYRESGSYMELVAILERVKEAALDGAQSLYTDPLDKKQVAILERLGYEISANFLSISWKKSVEEIHELNSVEAP